MLWQSSVTLVGSSPFWFWLTCKRQTSLFLTLALYKIHSLIQLIEPLRQSELIAYSLDDLHSFLHLNNNYIQTYSDDKCSTLNMDGDDVVWAPDMGKDLCWNPADLRHNSSTTFSVEVLSIRVMRPYEGKLGNYAIYEW